MPLNRNNVWENIGYWLAELAVIFIGVYLAFLLNGYRIKRENNHKKQQIYTALYRSFSISANIKKNNSAAFSKYVNPFLKAYRKKKMPRLNKLPFFTLAISDRTWNAMLQSGGLQLLDIKLVQQVSYFYYTVERLRQESTHFNRMSDKYLLPNYNADIHEFYNPKTKNLRKKYEWYVNFLNFYKDATNQMAEQSKQILKILKQKMNKKQLQKIQADSTR